MSCIKPTLMSGEHQINLITIMKSPTMITLSTRKKWSNINSNSSMMVHWICSKSRILTHTINILTIITIMAMVMVMVEGIRGEMQMRIAMGMDIHCE